MDRNKAKNKKSTDMLFSQQDDYLKQHEVKDHVNKNVGLQRRSKDILNGLTALERQADMSQGSSPGVSVVERSIEERSPFRSRSANQRNRKTRDASLPSEPSVGASLNPCHFDKL